MTTKLDKIIKTYKSLTQIPSLTKGEIYSSSIVNTVWSQRNLEKGKLTKFIKSTVLGENFKSLGETHPLDISNELLSSHSISKKFRAVLRELNGTQYLEVWQHHNLIRTVDLNALDAHGPVYSDIEFSSFEWSPDEKKLLYVAEKKPPKTEPFYKRKPQTDDENNKGDAKKPTKGEDFIFEEDWGEQLVGKKKSVIAQYDVENDKVELLDGIPDNLCAAQPKYSPDGTYIVGLAYETEPRKLGLIYCTNRVNSIFSLDFQSNYRQLNLKGHSAKCPIFSPDGETLVWLQREVFGPHHTCMVLVKTNLPLSENSIPQIVVDTVATRIQLKNGSYFYGLYNTGFINRPWASGNRLIINTPQKYTINSYVVNIENGEITELQYPGGSQSVLDVIEDVVLAVQRNYARPDQVVIGKLLNDSSLSWANLSDSNQNVIEGLEGSVCQYLDLSVTDAATVTDFNAIYLGPKSGTDKKTPVILWPHGGPHSSFANYFMLEAAMLLSLEYAILLVNYRGSTGSGKDSINFLLGKVGDTDVKDCITALDTALAKYSWLNPDAVALCGGSHGGFLVTHLSGQYPDRFKAVVARNPVIDLPSMSTISDIPDWTYVEAGSTYTQKGEIDSSILLKMRDLSPIVHAHKVKAPTMLQIGSKDLRVPPSQGSEYYFRLKTNGTKIKMNLYDDNHPLGTVPNEMNNIINTALWFEEHVGGNNQTEQE